MKPYELLFMLLILESWYFNCCALMQLLNMLFTQENYFPFSWKRIALKIIFHWVHQSLINILKAKKNPRIKTNDVKKIETLMTTRTLPSKYTELETEYLLIEVTLELWKQPFLCELEALKGMELRIWSSEGVYHFFRELKAKLSPSEKFTSQRRE